MGLDDEKGYFSIDAVFAVLILVAVSSTFITGARQNKAMAKETSAQIEQKMALEKIAGGINKVYANGYGEGKTFEMKMDVKENILEDNQRIMVNTENRFLYIKDLADGSISPIKANIIPSNIENFSLNPDNLSGKILIKWGEENIRLKGVRGW